MTKPFVVTDLIFSFRTTTDGATGKAQTTVEFFAVSGTPEPYSKARGTAGQIEYEPADEDAGRIAPTWVAAPADPSHPSFARVAFLCEEACTLFIKSQAMEAIIAAHV